MGFRTTFHAQPDTRTCLRIAASTLYRAWLNGKFLAHGPARAPHGFSRVDEWDLTPLLVTGSNLLAVEVAGYNVNAYSLINRPSFFQAEVSREGQVLASTGAGGAPFEAILLDDRVQKVQRYNFQRPFSEAYRLKPGHDAWRKVPNVRARVTCAVVAPKRLLPRRAPLPVFATRQPIRSVSQGSFEVMAQPDILAKLRPRLAVGTELGGFREEELDVKPLFDLAQMTMKDAQPLDRPYCPATAVSLPAGAWHILDFGTNLTGFVGAHVECREPVRLYLTFDEILCGNDVDFERLGCLNAVSYELAPGAYGIESFEPYTMRYLKLLSLGGRCEVKGVYLRELANPDVYEAQFCSSDARLNVLFEAGRETLRQNAVDIFMDCPSRERAGWLGDSFFTARVACDLCGHTLIERDFLENFLLPDCFSNIPDGMIPMCYPADHPNGVFIPNWALWFVLELEEYVGRSGDRDLAEALRPRVLKLLEYLRRFENSDGLLERLKGWVFIEWSKANEFVQDVNYPTNMLYAAALEAAGRMYGLPELTRRADMLRQVIRQQSFDGTFFVDNAMREGGSLRPTGNRTEICQYYAFFFGICSPETHPDLWQRLLDEFGPRRQATGAYPEVHPANAFMGNYLRMELLSRYGHCRQLLEESVDYLLYMAERTGTLWENIGPTASCNHGFASHVVHVLYRDILGLYRVDKPNCVVHVRLADLPLHWCSGRMPLGKDAVSLQWRRSGGGTQFRIQVPAGYEVRVENLTGGELTETVKWPAMG